MHIWTIVFTTTFPDHVSTLREVLACLTGALLMINLAKCEFGRATVTYFGKQVGQGQIQSVEAKGRNPSTIYMEAVTQIFRYGRLLPSFLSELLGYTHPLTSLTSPKIPFSCNPEYQHAFESVEALLCRIPVLAAPNF